ncbi:hypothetical protein [Streptomyces sp. H39-S7]|uniref:hypothetical protein n=1 Tax=Streptomyces sp. H39-S7 TaxID=3004357 RepID=UPI0022B03C12|nr:hypothetical protein [Streptomyces sp. H39-S7]MCZ4126133.1 hypothetical protein [Streptomyces sp. H39-S7]
MSSDGTRSKAVRQAPRVVKRAAVGWPRPLREFKDLVYELYLAAGAPKLDDITADIARDDRLRGAPERDTVHRCISAPGLPASQADAVAVVTVLARRAAQDEQEAGRQARSLWTAARMAVPAGRPIGEFNDRLVLRDLDVHPALDAGPAPAIGGLPPYVPREFDARLREVVAAAEAGAGGLAVLVGDSFTGKTRACWEAVQHLPPPWRLWHPRYPSGPEALLQGLDSVAPRTVLWLDDAQDFLAAGPAGEQAAAGLRQLLAEDARGPLLVLATLWPERWQALTADTRHSARLLGSHRVDVPTALTAVELRELAERARTDPRLREAAAHARDAEVIQYLAGGPALLDSYATARGITRALLDAAMDAHRLGNQPRLPTGWLVEAAPAYLTALERSRTTDDELQSAIAHANDTRPRLLLSLMSPPARGTALSRDGARAEEKWHQLADYLDQYGRHHRSERLPPPEFWTAATRHAPPGALAALGDAAWERGLRRDAVRLYRKAVRCGSQPASVRLLARFPTPEAARHVATHVSLAHTGMAGHLVTDLLRRLGQMKAVEAAAHLAQRISEDDPLEKPFFTAVLLEVFGPGPLTSRLAQRAALFAPLDSSHDVARLLRALHGVATDQLPTLATRIASHFTSTDPHALAEVIEALAGAGMREPATALAVRVVDGLRTDEPDAVLELFAVLRATGLPGLAERFAEDAVCQVPIAAGRPVADLLTGLTKVLSPAADTLLGRIAAEPWTTDEPWAFSQVLRALRDIRSANAETAHSGPGLEPAPDIPPAVPPSAPPGSSRVAEALAFTARQATRTRLDNPEAVAHLVTVLGEVNASEQAVTLVRRAAEECTPGELSSAATLLRAVHALGAPVALTTLARRCAQDSTLDSPRATTGLLTALHETGRLEETGVLAARAAAETVLDEPGALVGLLEALHATGAAQSLSVLGRRLARDLAVEEHPGDAVRLVDVLAGHAPRQDALALAKATVERLPDECVYEAALLFRHLQRRGMRREAAALAQRAAARAPLADGRGVAHLMNALHEADATGPCAVLLARSPADEISLVNPMAVAELLRVLDAVGADVQARKLARRAVDITLTNTGTVAWLIELLARLGLRDHLPALAERTAAEASLTDGWETTRLITALEGTGQTRAVRVVLDRLPAVGFADWVFEHGNQTERFRYGREPSGDPAARWSWQDTA